MTAIVGILNRRGIAIAADSASTINTDKGRKVLNTETKIFQLSKQHPVAVMIYGKAEFLHTPWDLIIKLYCLKRGNIARENLKEYVDDFLQFITSEPFFFDDEMQKISLGHQLTDFYCHLRNNAIECSKEEGNEKTFSDLFKEELEEIKQICMEKSEYCVQLAEYSWEAFKRDAQESIDCIIKSGFMEDDIDVSLKETFEETVYEWLKSAFFIELNTGLVFVGYGANDIYPSIYPIEVAGAFDNRLRYWVNESRIYQVDSQNMACVCPFAQGDVMTTFMNGISPVLLDKATSSFQTAAEQTRADIYRKLADAGVSDDILALVEETDSDEIADKLEEDFCSYIKNEKNDGFLRAASDFNIPELANMAEKLVHITNLQRHFSLNEETVDGPVDVAVITVDEGFVWVKRKLFPSLD